MASEAQVNYIISLAAKKDVSTSDEPGFAEWITAPNVAEALTTLTNQQVDEVLTHLKSLPWLPKETTPVIAATTAQGTPIPDLDAELKSLEQLVNKGRYFIIDDFDDPPTEKFIRINKPEPPSRWAGYTFIESQGSDYFYPIKDKSHRLAVLTAISKDPIGAMNEYGMRLGVCGNCGRTLTDRHSRLRGMGPICAAKILGAPTEEQSEILRKLGLI